MAKLTIEGNARQLQIILKGNRTRFRKYGLKALLTEEKQEESKTPSVLAKDVIASINACENLEDLKPFESDDRATVKAAYKTKFNSFE